MHSKLATSVSPSIYAIIPARGGSERAPGKNLALVNGQPLISWTIHSALKSALVDRTFVTTDDFEISKISKTSGAEIINRPSELSGPRSSSEAALLHALDWLQECGDQQPDLIVFLQATSPLRQRFDIDNAISMFIREGADSLLSVSPTSGFLWEVRNGIPSALTFDPNERPRSQELEDKFVIENGSIYIMRSSMLRKSGCRLGGKVVAYYQPAICSLDIDYPEDIDLATSIMQTTGYGV